METGEHGPSAPPLPRPWELGCLLVLTGHCSKRVADSRRATKFGGQQAVQLCTLSLKYVRLGFTDTTVSLYFLFCFCFIRSLSTPHTPLACSPAGLTCKSQTVPVLSCGVWPLSVLPGTGDLSCKGQTVTALDSVGCEVSIRGPPHCGPKAAPGPSP